MKNSIIKYFSIILFTLGGGITATWYLSTAETLSRPLRDALGMLVLFTSLIIVGILIIVILVRTDTQL